MIIKNTIENWNLFNVVVILGNFDGIHQGHQLLINKAKDIAGTKGMKTAVFTFMPHPAKLVIGDQFRLIYTEAEKIEMFDKQGIDYYIRFNFNSENKNMNPQTFIHQILIKKIGAKVVVVGKDYHFGKKASGDINLLKTELKQNGIEIVIIEKLQENGVDISSTRLRAAIERGDLKEFEQLTRRRFHITETVVNGQKLGRTIGFPTVNILPAKDKILPPNGVYISEILYNNKRYHGLSNVGISPSIENKPYSVETYILNFNESIYNQKITIYFIQYLRPEIKFDSIEELKKQISKDVLDANNYLKNFC